MHTVTVLGAALVAGTALAAPPASIPAPRSQTDAGFGSALATIPDLTGDGRDDFIVGARGETVGSLADAGRAYVYNGATLALLYTLTSPNPAADVNFGWAVAGIPDFDGDSRGDFAVGSPGDFIGRGVDVGRVYIYSGATGQFRRSVTIPVGERLSFFGGALAGMGDVNGDGRGDLAVGTITGESLASGQPLSGGRVWIYSAHTGALLRRIDPPVRQSGAGFGTVLCALPDVNGDGRADLAVGAPDTAQNGIVSVGEVVIFSGRNGQVIRRFFSPSPRAFGRFGSSLAHLGDVNADGRADFAFGAPGEGNISPNQGRVHVFGIRGRLLRSLKLANSRAGTGFGTAIAAIGDQNNDGRTDLLIGAPSDDTRFGAATGRAFVYSPATGAALSSAVSPLGASSAEFGSTAAALYRGNLRPFYILGDQSCACAAGLTSGAVHVFRP